MVKIGFLTQFACGKDAHPVGQSHKEQSQWGRENPATGSEGAFTWKRQKRMDSHRLKVSMNFILEFDRVILCFHLEEVGKGVE